MKAFSKMLAFVALASLIAGCKNDSQDPYSTNKISSSTTQRGNYTVHHEHSQLSWTLTPAQQGNANASGLASAAGEGLDVKNGQLLGGTVVFKLDSMQLLSAPGDIGKDKAPGGIRGKAFFNTDRYPAAKLEIASVEALSNDPSGATHMVSANLELRGKNRGVQFPARVIVNEEHVALMALPFKIDLTQWGMKLGKNGWDNQAEINLRIRGDAKNNK